jgi:hypothetical protein
MRGETWHDFRRQMARSRLNGEAIVRRSTGSESRATLAQSGMKESAPGTELPQTLRESARHVGVAVSSVPVAAYHSLQAGYHSARSARSTTAACWFTESARRSLGGGP